MGTAPGLISESASARWLAVADSASIAAAARLRQRTRPRPGYGIFITCETPRMDDQGKGHAAARLSLRSFAIAPNIKLEMTT